MSVAFRPVELSLEEFGAISKVVYEYCGIHLHERKRDLVSSRLSRRLHATGCTSYADYLDYVLADQNAQEFTTFIDRISTNLTSFFRESTHFDYFSRELIPSLLKTQPNPARVRIRGWSAGCSSGEEAYTIAVSLAEALPDISKMDVKVLASDISSSVLATAKKGCYPVERLATVPPVAREKYFDLLREDGIDVFRVKNDLKRMLIFKHINLMQSWPITTPLDFIFCRNVMIYFDRPTQQKLVRRFWELLKPGGILFIAHSESLSPIQHDFKCVQPAVYQRPRGDA